MNQSEGSPEVKEYTYVAGLTVTLGLATFLSNFFLLCVILKVLSKSDKYGIIIHTFFVCINDTLCGLLLFLAGVWRVYDSTTAHVCAYLILSSFALQIVSQANITCVCAQRYVFAKYIRKTYVKWKSVHTKTLVLVNALIGGSSLVFYFSQIRIDNIPRVSISCKLGAVMSTDVVVLLVNFCLGTLFIIMANIFCFLAICVLNTELNVVVQPSATTSNTASNTGTHLDENVRQNMKIRQQRATVTMLLIVLFFNISFLPTFIGNIATFFHVNIPHVLRRPILLALFVNSLANPIIIVTRVQDIRVYIGEYFAKIKTKF